MNDTVLEPEGEDDAGCRAFFLYGTLCSSLSHTVHDSFVRASLHLQFGLAGSQLCLQPSSHVPLLFGHRT